MKLTLGIDIGTGFCTATFCKDGNEMLSAFPDEADGMIPTFIVCNKNNKNDIHFGLDAVDKIAKDSANLYFKIAPSLKEALRKNRDEVVVDVNTIRNPENRPKIDTMSVASGFFKYIFTHIKSCLDNKMPNAEISKIALCYPNNKDGESVQYKSKLVSQIVSAYEECFHKRIEDKNIIVNSEASYAGIILANMRNVGDGETALIVDVGAGTTDIALVQCRTDKSEIKYDWSFKFGGNIVDNILEKGFGLREGTTPAQMIKYKNWFLQLGNDEVREQIPGKYKKNELEKKRLDIFNKYITNNEEYELGKRYQNTLQEIKDTLIDALPGYIKLDNEFKVVFTGGSYESPGVGEAVKEALQRIGLNEALIKFTVLANTDWAETRKINNENFMSVAATMVAYEAIKREDNILSDTLVGYISPKVGAECILAVKCRQRTGGIIFFHKLTDDEPKSGIQEVRIKGKFYTIGYTQPDGRADNFIGIPREDLYFLKVAENLKNVEDVSYCVDENDSKIGYIKSTDGSNEKGKKYTIFKAGDLDVISICFKPKYMPDGQDGGEAIICDKNDNEITVPADNKRWCYNLIAKYDYSLTAGYDEEMQISYKQVADTD